jgi:hypothetical protein
MTTKSNKSSDKFTRAINDLRNAAMKKAYVPNSARKIVTKTAVKVTIKKK